MMPNMLNQRSDAMSSQGFKQHKHSCLQPPILSIDWKNCLFRNQNRSTRMEERPCLENDVVNRNSSKNLSMSHYNPGICIYRPPSSSDNLCQQLQDNNEVSMQNDDSNFFVVGEISENAGDENRINNNNNHKHRKLLKNSSKISDLSLKKFYDKYNLKIMASPSELQKNLAENNNSIAPGCSILTLAKNMVKKYQPPITPEKSHPDFYSFLKNNGSNIFVSLSSQDLIEDQTSSPIYDENPYEEFNSGDYRDDDDARTKISGRTSSTKKFQTHVERVPMLSENQLASNNKKSRIYVNTNMPIKKAYNASNASTFLKERFHNRSLKCPEGRQGYDQTVHKVMKNLYDSWLDQSQCDVAIITDEGEIMSHQALLSSFSSTLAHQFKANKPSHDGDNGPDGPQQIAVIDMSRFSKETITDVLHFLYTTDLRLTDSNVTRFLMVAKKLELDVVSKKCEEYLLREGPNDDLLLHYFIANNCDLGGVKSELQAKVARNFNNICTVSNITKLSRSLLVGILGHKELASREENKLLAVSKWIDHNKTERMKFVTELMTFVKFEKIPIDLLTSLVENLEWMFTSSCMRNKLLEAYRYHTANDTSEPAEKQAASEQSSELCDNNNAYKSFHRQGLENKEASAKAADAHPCITQNAGNNAVETVEKESEIQCKCFNGELQAAPPIRKVEDEKFKPKVAEELKEKKSCKATKSPLKQNTPKPDSESKKKVMRSSVVEEHMQVFENTLEGRSSRVRKQSPEKLASKPKSPPKAKESAYNVSNSQNHQHGDHQQSCQYNDNTPLKQSHTRASHKKNTTHVGTSMTPCGEYGKKRASPVSSVMSWNNTTQGVLSIFESRFKPPPVKQYQLNNNLSSVKFIEIE